MSAAQVVATSFVFAICVGGAVILPRVWRGWYGTVKGIFRTVVRSERVAKLLFSGGLMVMPRGVA